MPQMQSMSKIMHLWTFKSIGSVKNEEPRKFTEKESVNQTRQRVGSGGVDDSRNKNPISKEA